MPTHHNVFTEVSVYDVTRQDDGSLWVSDRYGLEPLDAYQPRRGREKYKGRVQGDIVVGKSFTVIRDSEEWNELPYQTIAVTAIDPPFPGEPEEPEFYWQTLDADPNIADLLRNVSRTLSPSQSFGDSALYGVVSEADGGIIAYAVGFEHARQIVKALNDR